jgi:pSer/pThr/pTyr-binding forkhead associated (FHA) protein
MRAMEVKLIVERGTSQKRVYVLPATATTIGRRQDCELRIPSSDVSRRHCVLTIDDNYLKVEDLDSVNGTFVNGARVVGKQIVRPGDRLEVGPVRFLVKYELSPEAVNRLEQTVDAQSLQEELEDLPLAEVDDVDQDFELADIEEAIEEMPLAAEDETEFVAGQPGKTDPEPAALAEVDEDDDPIPFVDEFENGPSWKLPQAEELRNILTELDPEVPKKKPEEE